MQLFFGLALAILFTVVPESETNESVERFQNTKYLTAINHLTKLSATIDISLNKESFEEECYITPPGGEQTRINDLHMDGVTVQSKSDFVSCRVTIGPMVANLLGIWWLCGKSTVTGDSRCQVVAMVWNGEDGLTDWGTTIQDTTQYARNIHHSVRSVAGGTGTLLSCHVITPAGEDLVVSADVKYPHIENSVTNGATCNVIINDITEDMFGHWVVLSRFNTETGLTEIRQPLSIIRSENVVLQNDISITEGADLYLHLNYDITTPETCAIYGPDGEVYAAAEEDPLYPLNCGYVVKNVDERHTGEWILEYGDDVKWRASVKVNVLAPKDIVVGNLRWTIGDRVDITLGPEDAVYCRIEDPYGHIIFDGFSQCEIILERVALDHKGLWHMYVGIPGTVQLQTIEFHVSFEVDAPLVTTHLQKSASSVMMTCSVPIEHEVSSCTFRSPQGNTLVAAHGVGEDGFMFNGSFVRNYDTHDCTLRLLTPSIADFGIWRCAMHTNTGTFFGFLTVVCPHLMQNPQIAASVVTEPMLKSSSSRELSYEEYEPAVMSCTIQTQLRYCYFRTRNGTVYNVFPGMPSSLDIEYVGAGLSAGDCGIRFKRGLSHREGGTWSCHVGLAEIHTEEQRLSFNVDIRAQLSVQHYLRPSDPSIMVVETVSPYDMDYCRFVRMDGQGDFTTDYAPDRYQIATDASCTMQVKDPTILELHPWTVAVKFTGQKGEVSMTTSENMLASLMPSLDFGSIFGKIWFWVIIVICLVSVMVALALIPKRNRKWTYKRASLLRNSFRNSWNRPLHKEPLEEKPTTEATV